MRRTALQVWIGAAWLSYGISAAGAMLLTPSPDPYARDDAWLCRPGRQDTCSTKATATVLGADGSVQTRLFVADPKAPIDCFYVYPTISEDPHGNSELKIGPGEERAVAQQFAPFASVCRPYAPLYRQVTLAGLMSRYSAKPMSIDESMAYSDVVDAWHHYLKYDNHGRGVVLIGHSQGARWLVQLMQSELDVESKKTKLVSAVLLGWNVEVPVGHVMGGTFKTIPACTSGAQTNCVISFMTFRASAPPPAGGALHFGYATRPEMEALCSDPVALSGGPIQPIFPVATNLLGQPSTLETWKRIQADVQTPFVELDGLLDARCSHAGGASYLAVSILGSPHGLQPDDIPGDIIVRGKLQSDWGLHLDDANIAMGNLLNILQMQSQVFASSHFVNHPSNVHHAY